MFGICLGCDGRNATRREGARRYFYVGRSNVEGETRRMCRVVRSYARRRRPSGEEKAIEDNKERQSSREDKESVTFARERWGEAPINILKSTVVPASPSEYSNRESRLGPNKNKPERTQTTPRPPPPPEAGEDNDTAAE